MEPKDLNHAMPSLRDLIEKFLQGQLAQSNDFGDFTFEQIGDYLDEEKSRFHNLSNDNPEKKAFLEAIDLYCRIILTLEVSHLAEFLTRSPHELRTALAQGPATIKTDEYLAFANELGTLGALELGKENPSIQNKELLSRVRVFMLGLSLEKNCIETYRAHIERFFKDRETARRLLFDGRRIKKELLDAIQEMEKQNGRWLYKGKFLYSNVPTAIHYLFQAPSFEQYVPTLFECGILTLLFGQDHVGSFNSKNILGLGNVAETDIIEFAFRISRAQRIKTKLFSLVSPASPNHVEVLEHDIQVISKLLKSFEFFHNLGAQVA